MTSIAHGPKKEASRLRWLPLFAAVAAVATASPFAWDGKNFGTFLLLIFLYMPVIALVSIALCIWAVRERKSARARSIVSSLIAMLTLIGATFWTLPAAKDELRFLIWSLTHDDALLTYADRNAVVLGWESWGLAGMENSAYLVSNPTDDLAGNDGAAEWLRQIGSSCEIVASKRMRRGFYIVTTYHCPLQ